MGESKDLKAGDTATYEIAGKTVTVEPLTLGKMKKATEVFLAKDGNSFEMLEEHLFEIMGNGKNPFATREWIRENVTIPQANRIIDDLRAINGMELFRAGSTPKETRPLVEATGTV